MAYETHGNILLNLGPLPGTAAIPDILFLNSSLSGFFLKADSTIGVAVGGVEVFNFSPSGGSEVGQLILADGTAAAPSLAFGGASSNTGLFLKAADSIGFSLNGTERASFASTGALTLTIGATISATTNQLVLGATNTTTISSTAPAASRVYTIPDAGGAAQFVMNAGAQTIAGAKTFSSAIIPSAGITGTATNDSAAAGIVGETVVSNLLTASAVSLATGTAKTVTSISLTAGDWDVSGAVVFKPAATTSVTIYASAVSQTTDAVPATIGNDTGGEILIQRAQAANIPTTDFSQVIPRIRVSLSGTTTVFLAAKATFSVDTLGAYGTIRARRMR